MQNVARENFARKIRNFESETTSEPIFNSLKKASCASVEGSALIDHLNGKVNFLNDSRETYIALVFFALEGFLASGPWNILVFDHVLHMRSKYNSTT